MNNPAKGPDPQDGDVAAANLRRRSVLIVTPYFAPQTHAAVFRAYKLAKYLPRYGWKPYVLTVATNYLYNEDPRLLQNLPPEVEIETVRYVEPTLRGVRMALGGRDRTFLTQKDWLRTDPFVEPGPAPQLGLAPRAYHHLLHSWLQTPDAYWTWYRPALRAARRLVRLHNIDLVYTTCLPYTSHRIGLALQREGRRWVADFRDPTTYATKQSSQVDRVYHWQRRIQRDTLRNADAVTVLSSAYAHIFRDMYGPITRSPIRFIPTGLDEDLLKEDSPDPSQSPYLVFTGEFLEEYGYRFFEILATAMKNDEVRRLGIKLLVVGHIVLNRQRLVPQLRQLVIEELVEFRDHIPQEELYRVLRRSVAGVLIPGVHSHWWNNFAKMVDYIALRTPVVALVPDPSEARTALTRSGLGVFLDGDLMAATGKLVDFLTGRVRLQQPNGVECDRYLAQSQVRAFVDVFEELVEPVTTIL